MSGWRNTILYCACKIRRSWIIADKARPRALAYEAQRGLYLHPTLAVTPDRLCLGVLDALICARSDDGYGKSEARKRKALEEKESVRWIDGYRQVCELADTLPDTQCVYIADRESDVYELFVEGDGQTHRADWLIRASHDRRLLEEACLSNALAQAPALGEIEFDLPPSHKRQEKQVTQTLKAARVELQPPQRYGNSLDPVEVTVLLAQETRPPKGEEPVTWVLLTNLPVTTAEQAIEKISWYLCRWQIGVSGEGHIDQSVKVRPRSKGSGLVAWEAPWRESKAVEPSDPYTLGVPQRTRLQRAVNVEVASSHAFPVAETVYNARKQQGLIETSPKRQLSPAGYQRRHGAKVCVSTGETLGARRRNLVEEVHPITVSGKWMGRHQGGGSGCNTVDRRATKRAGREGPGPVGISLVQGEAGAR